MAQMGNSNSAFCITHSGFIILAQFSFCVCVFVAGLMGKIDTDWEQRGLKERGKEAEEERELERETEVE